MEESSRISRLRQLFPVCENRFCPVLVRWLMVASALSQSFQDCRGVGWLQFGFDFDSFCLIESRLFTALNVLVG